MSTSEKRIQKRININMNNMLKETQTVKYRVQVNGVTLNESLSQGLAEQFIATLLPEQRSNAVIIPVTESGAQILLG